MVHRRPTGPLPRKWSRLCAVGLAASLAVLPIGCGAQKYRDRVDKTARYYKHLHELDRNLADKWQQDGVELRVPRQFRPLASLGEWNGPVLDGSHRRTGDSLRPTDRADLPGLLGAWRAELTVEGAEPKQPGFLYVAARPVAPRPDAAENRESAPFERRFIRQLAAAFGEAPLDENAWTSTVVPQAGGYVEQKTFRTAVMTPSRRLKNSETRYEIRAYAWPYEAPRVVIAFVLPRRHAAEEKLTENERIGQSLQTLRVIGDD